MKLCNLDLKTNKDYHYINLGILIQSGMYVKMLKCGQNINL